MNLRHLTVTAVFAAVTVTAFAAAKDTKAIETAVNAPTRSADAKSRDQYRHPVEALAFWGLKPGANILEVAPGAGWWTEILAPFARQTHGHFSATAADLDDPKTSEGARKGRADFAAKFSDKAVYGDVQLVNWGANAKPLPADQYDFVLVGRMFHNWIRGNAVDKSLATIYAGLKPGGVLAIEQHRAPPSQDPTEYNGYVPEAYVISQVEKAGFKLAGKSEVNANPKDTKDHPFGVWTLPPVRQSAKDGDDPKFDHTKYDAIGESDRMTLKFVKPAKKQ